MNCNDFLYHIDRTNNIVYFCPEYVWVEDGYCADSYSEEEWEVINPVLDELDLAEIVDSGFEPIDARVKIQNLESQIIELGFQKNKKFSKFMSSFMNEATENDDDEESFEGEDYDEEPSELNFDR